MTCRTNSPIGCVISSRAVPTEFTTSKCAPVTSTSFEAGRSEAGEAAVAAAVGVAEIGVEEEEEEEVEAAVAAA